jgi:hypothetical protein
MIELDFKIDYMTKQQPGGGGGGIIQSQDQLSMDKEVLDMYLDFAVTSLFGKVGSAPLQYLVKDYSRKNCTLKLLTDRDSCEKVYNALVLCQSTMDGINAVRFNLSHVGLC